MFSLISNWMLLLAESLTIPYSDTAMMDQSSDIFCGLDSKRIIACVFYEVIETDIPQDRLVCSRQNNRWGCAVIQSLFPS